MGYFLELRKGLTSVLGSTHVVEQLSCSMFLSNLTFDFDLILVSIFTFRGPNGLLFGVEGGFDICFGVYLCS